LDHATQKPTIPRAWHASNTGFRVKLWQYE
jgi:hypothetical protein